MFLHIPTSSYVFQFFEINICVRKKFKETGLKFNFTCLLYTHAWHAGGPRQGMLLTSVFN